MLRIGIVWQGNPTNAMDARRSIPLRQFAALAMAGVQFFSIQKVAGIEQLGAINGDFGVIDLGSRLVDRGGAFTDTAAVMQCLDLVITCDTAAAHLAGALGVPVWVALCHAADWRWMSERTDSPWYPTMKLFRQPAPGDWPSVFQAMAAELRRLQGTRTTVADRDPGTAHGRAAELIRTGVAQARQGHIDRAIARFREALHVAPDHAAAQQNLGVALAEKGLFAEAVASLRVALAQQPDYHDAHYNLGNVLGQLKRPAEAIAAYRDALRLKPDHPGTLNNLGLLLTQNSAPEEGAVLLRQACRLREKFLEAINNLGLALTEMGDYAGAIARFEEALRIDPHHVDSHSNLGNVYKDQGRLDEALACYDLALLMRPDAPSPRWNRALVLLHKGDYERGWPEYEARRRKPDSGIRTFAQPDWDGSPPAGRTILIHMEQGLGDMLQFIRYAPRVNAQGGRVIVSCPRTLTALFARCAGIDQVVCDKDPLPPFDVQVPLLSLPGLLRTTLETVPAEVPYLFADDALVQSWQHALAGLSNFRVGIAWQGNPRHRRDRQRSIPLAQFERLARVPGISVISLQKGHGAEQLASRCRASFAVEALGSAYDGPDTTFMDTAAVLRNLDLVITVDTAVAHLAGGLGVPVWLALPQTADWRWLIDRSDSPWYPTMRLFRQDELGRWEPMFDAMARELAERASGGLCTPSLARPAKALCNPL
jgi:tetratricopeptide (TPR) repeat protein/ADP-heptose:LPS heptosyltransferase